MNIHETINYVEFPAKDLAATKQFFTQCFSWAFEDYGLEYTAFTDEGLDGGFFYSEQSSATINGAALIIFYSSDLAATYEKVKRSGGNITKEVFEFPGGKRFHFTEPSGNEFAVWCTQP